MWLQVELSVQLNLKAAPGGRCRLTGGQDAIRYPTRLIERLGYLFSTVSVGDFRPTDQQGEVHTLLKERLLRIREAIDEVLDDDLADFNRRIQSLGMGVIS